MERKTPDTASTHHLDRTDPEMAGIDHPGADDPAVAARRRAARRGDRSTHRAHHGLYEDLLN